MGWLCYANGSNKVKAISLGVARALCREGLSVGQNSEVVSKS